MRNRARKLESETTLRVAQHYRRAGLDKGWTIARWESFCGHFRGLTEAEVSILFNIGAKEMRSARERGRLNTSTSTFLAWIESAILEMHGIASKPVLPIEFMHLKNTSV